MKKRWHVFISCVHIVFINVTLWTKCWTYSSKVQRNYVKLYCDYFTIKASIHIYIIFRYILSRAFIVKGPEVTVSAAEWERGCIINTQHHNTHETTGRPTNVSYRSGTLSQSDEEEIKETVKWKTDFTLVFTLKLSWFPPSDIKSSEDTRTDCFQDVEMYLVL